MGITVSRGMVPPESDAVTRTVLPSLTRTSRSFSLLTRNRARGVVSAEAPWWPRKSSRHENTEVLA